jgi:predicted nucleic acid-binding Zn ribbon protein
MPLYAYRCADGHYFERHGKIDGSDFPSRCPECVDPESINCRCEARVEKVITAPASVFPGADGWRSKNGV